MEQSRVWSRAKWSESETLQAMFVNHVHSDLAIVSPKVRAAWSQPNIGPDSHGFGQAIWAAGHMPN